MKEQYSGCNWVFLVRGLMLFISDFFSAYFRAWKKSMRGETSHNANFFELLVMATIVFILILAFISACEIIYLIGIVSIYLDGTIDISSINFIWWLEETNQYHVMFEAGFPLFFKLSLIFGGAICLYNFVMRMCERGQPGAYKMFVD